jgi:hypothetical protein
MKTLASSFAFALILATPCFAFAQEDGTSPASPDEHDDTSAPPPAPAHPSSPVQASGGGCVLGAHAGIAEADAQTAARLVCGEIARRGPARGATFRVGLGRLGRSVILSATMEPEPGVIQDERHITLTDIEEVAVAAPRIAESIVHGSPIAETMKVDNVVGEESRVYKKRSGSVHFATGIIGVLPPFGSASLDPAPGISLELHYETARFAAFVDARFAGTMAEHSTTDLEYQALGIGGRYYTSDADVAPYLAGGLAFSHAQLRDTEFSGQNGGFGAFGEIGIEALRTHHAHLTLGVRVDVPFYSLQNTSYAYSAYIPAGSQPVSPAKTSSYYAPTTLALTLTF